MRKPIVITTPMPTFEEVAREYRIGKRRQAQILRIMRGGARPIAREKKSQADEVAAMNDGKQS